MLALTRKVGQKIHIGPDIAIQVVEVYGSSQRVKLAIDAPRHLAIVRDELAGDARPALERRAAR